MKKARVVILFLFTAVMCRQSLEAQRFSFLAELGGMRSQIEGDKIHGFFYNGYTLGIGSNYTITQEHFLAVKTTYYKQGSQRRSDQESIRREGFQLEVDLNTVGLELTYKHKPQGKSSFYGIGLVRHQLVDLNYNVVESQLGGPESALNFEEVKSGFNSLKLFYGIDLFKRASIYASVEASISNVLRTNYYEIQKLVPYSLAVIFSYEIFSPKEVTQKKRPGSRSRI